MIRLKKKILFRNLNIQWSNKRTLIRIGAV